MTEEKATKPKRPKKSFKQQLDGALSWVKKNKVQVVTFGVMLVVIVALTAVLLVNSDNESDIDDSIEAAATLEELEINSIEDLETAKKLLEDTIEEEPEEVDELQNLDSGSSNE